MAPLPLTRLFDAFSGARRAVESIVPRRTFEDVRRGRIRLIHRRAEFNAATLVFAAPSAHESGDAYRVMSRLRLISRITGVREEEYP